MPAIQIKQTALCGLIIPRFSAQTLRHLLPGGWAQNVHSRFSRTPLSPPPDSSRRQRRRRQTPPAAPCRQPPGLHSLLRVPGAPCQAHTESPAIPATDSSFWTWREVGVRQMVGSTVARNKIRSPAGSASGCSRPATPRWLIPLHPSRYRPLLRRPRQFPLHPAPPAAGISLATTLRLLPTVAPGFSSR